MSQSEFIGVLGKIWEETPEIASKTWHNKPFKNIETLYQAMVAVVTQMNDAEQLALIKAHPDYKPSVFK